jgi:hypothetical protein
MTSLKILFGKLLEKYDEECWSRAMDLDFEGKKDKAIRVMYHGLPIQTARYCFALAEVRALSKSYELKTWYTYSRFFYYILLNRLNTWLDKPFLSK